MKSKKYLGLGILVLLVLVAAGGLVLAENSETEIDVEYDFNDSREVKKTIKSDAVLLSVTTNEDAECRYVSGDEGNSDISFENMSHFNTNFDKRHEKTFSDLKDKASYTYYVKCIKDNESIDDTEKLSVLTVELEVDKLIKGDIIFPDNINSPLKAGNYKIELKTTKISSSTPTLKYSFDDGSQHNIPLTKISDKRWNGYLNIPEDLGEKSLYFEFKAVDLKGRVGDEIIGESVFNVDTVAPDPISDIEAIGHEGKVKLKWHYDKDVEKFNIYRSNSRDVDKTDTYEETKDPMFTDTFVESGKKYYYKVAPVDEAGNEARLSLEVSATALSENNSDQDTGLDVELRGNVDNVVTQADSLISQVNEIKSSIDTKSEDKKELFSLLELEDKLDSAISKIKSLKRSVESYKQQDLSESDLDNKLDSAKSKIRAIEKTIPEEVSIKETDTQDNKITEEDIQTALLEARPEMSSSLREKSVEQTLEFLEKREISIKTFLYVGKITYFDGSDEDVSVVKRKISSDVGAHSNMSFLEIIPKKVAEDADDINFKNSDYEVVKQDPIISFSSDVKQVAYSLDEEISIDSLKDTGLVFITIFEEGEGGTGITGHFVNISDVDGTYIGVGIGILVVGFLFLYLFYLRKNKPSQKCIDIKNMLNSARDNINRGYLKESIRIYKNIKNKYNSLEKKDKSKVYEELQELFIKIQTERLNRGMEDFKKNKEKSLFQKLDRVYQSLPEKDKKKFPGFEELKKEVENEN